MATFRVWLTTSPRTVDITAFDYTVANNSLVEFVDDKDDVTTTVAPGMWVMISTVEDEEDKDNKRVVGFVAEVDSAA